MSKPIPRYLMLWFFVVLQAMTPFIHAHAGAVQLDHAGFLHGHQGAHSDAAWHVMSSDGHGAEVAVAQGMPLRHDAPGTMADVPAPAADAWLSRTGATARAGAGWPAPPPRHRPPPDHTLPHALAPPHA